MVALGRVATAMADAVLVLHRLADPPAPAASTSTAPPTTDELDHLLAHVRRVAADLEKMAAGA
jgi:hypothetical protein